MYLNSYIVVLLNYLSLVPATSPIHGIPLDVRGQALSPRVTNFPVEPRDVLPTGTCNSQTPCANGACCGSDNRKCFSELFLPHPGCFKSYETGFPPKPCPKH